MPDNTGIFMLLGLGALLFLGGNRRIESADDTPRRVSTSKPVVVTSSGVPAVIVPEPEIIAKTTKAPIGGSGAQSIVETTLEIQREEQVNKQRFDWAAGAVPPATSFAESQGDLDALAIAEGTFDYGGAERPTNTAIPIWNTRYGWYWANPASGLPVGPGGAEWSPKNTTVSMGAEDTNIGRTLPAGWTDTGGGSARLVTAAPNTINQRLTVSEPGATIVLADTEPLTLVNGYGPIFGGAEDE